MTPPLVLVHGWGFHAGLWSEMLPLLGQREVRLVDLGFISGGPASAKDWPDGAIGVGHSLGLMWLLHHASEGRRFRGLVSIQGFDRFCPHVPEARVLGMRRGLARDPATMLAAFWRGCGTTPFAPPEALNRERLDEGLGWLLDWDERAKHASLDCPILALAARDDAIVPPPMSASVFGSDKIAWSETGGHVLPLSRPEWCAKHVLDFAHDLKP